MSSIEQHIKDLEVQAEMMHQIGFNLTKKATALRKELASCGADASSILSNKDREFQEKASRILAIKRKNRLKKSVQKNNAVA